MASQEVEVEQRVVAVVVIAAILLAVGLALGFGIHKSRPKAAPAPAAVAAAPSADASADAARVVVEGGVVKFFFATGKADLAVDLSADVQAALNDAAAAAKAGKKLVVSGFHDSTGDAAVNAELAKQRALTVQAVLVNLGADAAAIELKKPEEMLGGTDNAQARRVEVVVQ
ncbi:OmpA family protein [Hydrogenophaga defluvii]|uniref:OmpA family protein n=1 Tax=Hydrogenophaga defluvii TaxID=249410 RepID=A0ABW2SG60_9BURK